MNFLTKLHVTLLASILLSACGSGGSQGNNQTGNTIQSSDSERIIVSPIQVGNIQILASQDSNLGSNLHAVNNEMQAPNVNSISHLDSSDSDDQSVFASFSKNGGNHEYSALIKIILDGKNIALAPIDSSTLPINKQEVKTLRTAAGQLIGYYGYARVDHLKPNTSNYDEILPEHKYLPLLEMASTANKIIPNNNMTYEGNAYFAYNDKEAEALEARVTAQYEAAEKRLKMQISPEGSLYLVLKDSPNGTEGSVLKDDGTIFGGLYSASKDKFAEFTGGIYGENGEILTGVMQNGKIKGVIGANQK